MNKYIITQEYYDTYPSLCVAGYNVGDIVYIDDDGYLQHEDGGKGAHTDDNGGDPVLPPPQSPPILP